MNNYHFFNYDNTLEGLFTLVFEKYKCIEHAYIKPTSVQTNFFDDVNFVVTDLSKADRVKKSITKNFGNYFLTQILYVYCSYHDNKEDIIAKTIKGMYVYGKDFLYSSNKFAVEFNKIVKKVAREIHTFKGLLRFKEIEGGVLFAEFSPDSDILYFLIRHFKERMPDENFIIYDSYRNYAAFYFDKKVEFISVENFDIKETSEEKFFKDIWCNFYNSVSIKERKNTKLMKNNMPIKYWKYLPEKNNIKIL
ncbi:putative DNA metabolism protein [Peptoniphilus olsenii]|uniref:DNA metabolism protein n=1 Tax=Peptoniphilus olsenii TaxID=411570 RepID=A0ABV2JAG1_9FIRM